MRYLPTERKKYYQIVLLKDLPLLQIHYLLVRQLEQQGGAIRRNKSLFIWMMEET